MHRTLELNLEYLVFCRNLLQNTLQTYLIGIGDKNLAKMVFCHQTDDLFHPVCIKFIKYIMQ